jgi:integrase
MTWVDVASAAGYSDPFSLQADLVYDVVACLWKSGFRSIESYLSIARQEMTLRNGSFPESMVIHFRRVARAAARGRGPPRQATELPFTRLQELPDTVDAIAAHGPAHPRRLAIIASWWMLREMEVANLTLSCLSFSGLSATLLLPCSKTDSTGIGASRSLSCSCESAASDLCPYHALRAQGAFAASMACRFFNVTSAVGMEAAIFGRPLFPDAGGTAISKLGTSHTVMQLASALKLELFTVTGAPRFSGHTFRATGAMHLASSGIDVWRIQLHGRWGSDAVLRYVRLAPLAGHLSLEASLGKDLKTVQAAISCAKGELARLEVSTKPAQLQQTLDEALGPQLAICSGPLGKPLVSDILGTRTKWSRTPKDGELLVLSAKNIAHSCRPPQQASTNLVLPGSFVTWCGWSVVESSGATAAQWCSSTGAGTLVLCQRCFGAQSPAEHSSSSSSGNEM